MGDRLSTVLAALVALVGVGVLLLGLSVFFEAWQANRAFAGMGLESLPDEYASEEPIWLDETRSQESGVRSQEEAAARASEVPPGLPSPPPPLPDAGEGRPTQSPEDSSVAENPQVST